LCWFRTLVKKQEDCGEKGLTSRIREKPGSVRQKVKETDMADYSRMRLGRRVIQHDSRTLVLARYMTPALPAPPPTADWTGGCTNWGMMLNDRLGDCTIAGVGHAVQVWTASTGSMETVSDSVVESCYEKWDGYDPSDPDTDAGGIELEVLKNWRKQGFAGHRLLGFADPKPTNLTEIRQSIAFFGGVYIGLALPLTAQRQDQWDVATDGSGNGQAGSWGGHCVFVPRYDENGFTCITWGALKTMTAAFWQAYCDEAHTLLGFDWVTSKGSPDGFRLAQLQADLKALQQGS